MKASPMIHNLKWSCLGIILAWVVLYFFLPFGLLLLGVLTMFYLIKSAAYLWKKQRSNAAINVLLSVCLAGTALYFWQYHPNLPPLWTMGTLTGLLMVLMFSWAWKASK